MCHINRLKLYCDRETTDPEAKSLKSLSAVGYDALTPRATLSTVCGAEVASPLRSAAVSLSEQQGSSLGEDEGRLPSVEVIEGRMKNSEVLCNLTSFLSHLPVTDREDLISLIKQHVDLFPDVPRRTTAIVHDIDVGTARPIKQHPYHANLLKRSLFQKKVKLMV